MVIHRQYEEDFMALQMIETRVDDLDGSPAAETISFGLDGETYEIDLSKRNAAAFRRVLDRYIGAAHGSADERSSRRRSRRTIDSEREYDIAQLREWAATNEVEVPARGRIPRAVVDEFLAANRGRRRRS
jgi:hypothetical protein